VLKGALLFAAWGGPKSRPTKDIDLLGRMNNRVEAVASVMWEVMPPSKSNGRAFSARQNSMACPPRFSR